VIMLSASGSEEDILAAVAAGAKGYVLKDCTTGLLVEQIRKVAAGGVAISDSMFRKMMASVAKRPSEHAQPEPPMEQLSERELDVLGAVARGLSNRGIAFALTISESTVRAHLRSLMQKVGTDNRTQLAIYAVREGIVDSSQTKSARVGSETNA
jgi:DNA-binding NarL/FixJ family response regulator